MVTSNQGKERRNRRSDPANSANRETGKVTGIVNWILLTLNVLLFNC